MRSKFYSRTKFSVDKLILSEPSETWFERNKPEGGWRLWASGNIGDGDEVYTQWDKYIDESMNSWQGIYSYLFEITPNWNRILKLMDERDYIDYFSRNRGHFLYKNFRGTYAYGPVYQEMAMRYAGLYIADMYLYHDSSPKFIETGLYDPDDESEILLRNFNDWSVETLVVWHADGIEKIKMFQERG